MPRAAVTVTKSDCERGYRVACGKIYDMTRVFLWGEFDDCTISWQEARAHAIRYATDWSRTTKRRLVITPTQ